MQKSVFLLQKVIKCVHFVEQGQSFGAWLWVKSAWSRMPD